MCAKRAHVYLYESFSPLSELELQLELQPVVQLLSGAEGCSLGWLVCTSSKRFGLMSKQHIKSNLAW